MSTYIQIPLDRYAEPALLPAVVEQSNSPLSFKEWIKFHRGLIPEQEYKQYNNYLISWYNQKKETDTSTRTQIRLNYLTLLKQIQLFFSKEEAESWYNNVDLNSEKEMLLAIPYFARKLKEISLYYLKLREKIKQARLSYNQTGTDASIIEQIQNILITNYTQQGNKTTSIPSVVWNNVVELSGVTGVLTVEIEELYDKQNYLDKSPTVPVSAYFNYNSNELYNFLTTKGLSLTSTEWIYKLGIHGLSGLPSDFDQELLSNDAPAGVETEDYKDVAESIKSLQKELAEKYISADKFLTVQAPGSSIESEIFSVSILAGDNYFLWPGVAHVSKAKTLPIYRSVFLRDLNLENIAMGGDDFDSSDKIFVKTRRGVEGAWLAKNPTVYSDGSMYAVIDGGTKTTFLYPFPGYGLSAEGYNWTGPSLTATPQYFYLEDIVKESIENEYWSLDTSLTSTNPININDSTLVKSKAYPNTNYNLADKIVVKKSPPTFFASSDAEETEEAWLYRMNQTDISIGANQENIIYWPYTKINRGEVFPYYLPNNPADTCLPVSVSAIDLPFAIAGDSLTNSDVIYKITNYTSTTANAIECCWLSGNVVQFPYNRAYTIKQNGFQGIFYPGEYTKFIWTGRNNTDVNTVFKSLKHQPDCKYVTTKATYQSPETCTCNQILFAPFGHPGGKFSDYNSLADFLVEDNTSFQQVDLTNLPLSSFCWFKTLREQGWGDGEWITTRPTSNNKFYLQTGKTYGYFRAISRNENIGFPALTIRYNFNTYKEEYKNKHVWVRAYKDSDNNWVSSQEPTSMVVNPGDLLLYQRNSSSQYSLTGTEPKKVYTSENRGSVWSNVDYLTIDDGSLQSSLQEVIVTYPSRQDYPISSNRNKAYPVIPLENIISYIRWEVKHNQTNSKIFSINQTAVTFKPALTGQYTISLTAVSAVVTPTYDRIAFAGADNSVVSRNTYSTTRITNSAVCIFTNIPLITAIGPDTTVPTLTTFGTPFPGFVINTPLRGWDYNLNEPATNIYFENIGAKPFWAKTNKEYRGARFSGLFPKLVDEHNIIYQPDVSDVVFNTGQYIEYIRNYTVDLNWIQPLTLTTQAQTNQWCTIEIQTTGSNFNTAISDLVFTPTLSESNIVLQNYVDNEPVEIYYDAIESFTWEITAIPEINQTKYAPITELIGLTALQPWANLTNQQFPTVAVFPTLDQLYSVSDSGGYFLPSKLGASKYLNLGYTATVINSAEPLTTLFEDSKTTVQTRGFTKQDQPSYYKTKDNNTWLKEPITTGPIAGTISKNIFKKYQKFIPYQSKYESAPQVSLGLVLPDSRQTPWGGTKDTEWTDLENKPISPTGELDIKKWADAQILKQTSLLLDNWSTDIFGNQYGLYKDIKNIPSYNRKLFGGTLWTRTNKQKVAPSYLSLSRVFDTYKSTSLYSELTGFGIRKIDVFFDTLYIQTSGAILFEKINYDFDNDTIFSTPDDARFISLAQPVTPNLQREFNDINLSEFKFASVGDTWFLPELKKVLININNINYTPADLYNSTFSWEFINANTSTFTLSGNFPLPVDPDAYVVSVGGVLQPYTTYTITPSSRRLTFNTSIPPNKTVYVLLLYNPLLADEYDFLPTQFVTTSTVLTSRFSLNDFSHLTQNEGQYIVTINGVLQRPKNLSNNQQTLENSYTIISDGLPAIEFTEPIRPGYTITLTRLPQHIKCISIEPFYTWVKIFSTPTRTITLNGGPGIIADRAAYIVNVGGVLQSTSNFTINKQTRTITFVENIPANTYVSITQLSVPQLSIPEPKIYELDLNTQRLKLIFPVTPEHEQTLEELSNLRITDISSASMSYNPETSEILLTNYGINCNEIDFILEVVLNYKSSMEIKSFTVYEGIDQRDTKAPPCILDNLYTTVPATLITSNELNVTYPVVNGPATFVKVRGPEWVSLSRDGRFSGTVPKINEQYNVEFYIENSVSKTYYNLLINVVINNNV